MTVDKNPVSREQIEVNGTTLLSQHRGSSGQSAVAFARHILEPGLATHFAGARGTVPLQSWTTTYRRGRAPSVRGPGWRWRQPLTVPYTLALVPALKEAAVPTRLVWGRDDEFQKIEFARRYVSEIPGSDIVEVAGKHIPTEDSPQEVADAILEHLRA